MTTFQVNPANLALLIFWAALWVTGGCWIVRAAFNLRPNELFLTGFGAGWIIETLFANVLAAWLPLPLLSWLAALLVLLLGLAFSFTAEKKLLLKIPLSFWQVAVFLFLAYVFTAIARGLALFDDYAHLPTLSIMATGEIPPRFALDPSASYGYHYFLLLFSTELMHIGKLFPWEALDVGRGFSTALAILLSLVWVQRLTRSLLGGFLGALMVAFGTGTRWFLLFLPENLMRNVSSHLSLLGSGFNTSPSLYEAMVKPWALDGGGPFPFPFAYINGISTPGVLNLNNPNGLIGIVSGVILLLTFNRWKGWRGVLVSTLIFGTSGLLGEGAPASVGIFLVITLAWMLRKRSLRLPSSLWQWWIVIGVGTFLSVILGGVWTEILRDWLSSLAGAAAKTYQDISFVLTWSPTIVSSHLGVLELRNPYQLLVALAEIGPALLALPLVCIWAWKAFRAGRWYEVSVILFGLASLAALLVEFAGAHGVRNTTRLYGFIGICFTFGVPAVWMWVEKRSAALKILAALLGLVVIFGGLMTLAVELIAAPKPVYTTFLTDLDVQVMQAVWNRTDAGALVFDMDPFRGPTVLGRHTNSSITLYQSKPEWQALEKAPLPADLRQAGYSYVYMDDQSWWGLDRLYRDALGAPCVHLVDEASSGSAFRRLLDIRGCQ